jgi:hypothetical protein
MSQLKRIEENITELNGFKGSSGQLFEKKIDALYNENWFQLKQNIEVTIDELVKKRKHKKIVRKFMREYISNYFDDFTNAVDIFRELDKM